MMKSRIISGVIAFGYLSGAYFAGGPPLALRVAAALIFPLACIWFSDAMGDYIGLVGQIPISRKTPGCFVAFGGWLLLALPLLAMLIIRAGGS